MNKLVFFSVLLLAIFYIQCADTCNEYATEKDGQPVTVNEAFCKALPTSDKTKKECALDTKTNKCKEVDKATSSTSSADMISIYKISLALFIIFAIL